MTTEILRQHIQSSVALALAEDIADGDITAALLDANSLVQAEIVCREAATLCGIDWFNEVFAQLSSNVTVNWLYSDGDAIPPGEIICVLNGPVRTLLSGERSALNFLQSLSATATATRRFVKALHSTKTQLLDTRKTIPGLRLAQKYAVRCGGGKNHRIGLFDAYLIKENHIAAAGGISQACQRARNAHPEKLLEVEVETLAELQQALDAQVDRIMLDNFSLDDIYRAVEIADKQTPLEVSGNIEAHQLQKIAETGIDFVSVGAITKNIQAVDFSMRLVD